MQIFEGDKERIKKMFDKVELSGSSYDTAWVAMIPSPSSPQTPLFPQTLNWLLENQFKDGSWGLTHGNELLIKDSLLSTLASVLALKQWGVGELQTNRGIDVIKFLISNFNVFLLARGVSCPLLKSGHFTNAFPPFFIQIYSKLK